MQRTALVSDQPVAVQNRGKVKPLAEKPELQPTLHWVRRSTLRATLPSASRSEYVGCAPGAAPGQSTKPLAGATSVGQVWL